MAFMVLEPSDRIERLAMSEFEQVTYNLSQIDTLLTLLTLLVTATGVALGYSGLKTWKEELSGRTRYTLASRLLVTVLELRDNALAATSHVNELLGVAEGPTYELYDYLENGLGTGPLYRSRKATESTTEKLRILSREAEVVWGPELAERIAEVITHIGSYYEYATQLASDCQSKVADVSERVFEEELTTEQLQKVRADLDSTAFANGLDSRVRLMREYLAPYIELAR